MSESLHERGGIATEPVRRRDRPVWTLAVCVLLWVDAFAAAPHTARWAIGLGGEPDEEVLEAEYVQFVLLSPIHIALLAFWVVRFRRHWILSQVGLVPAMFLGLMLFFTMFAILGN